MPASWQLPLRRAHIPRSGACRHFPTLSALIGQVPNHQISVSQHAENSMPLPRPCFRHSDAVASRPHFVLGLGAGPLTAPN